jgi:hypothetical protein
MERDEITNREQAKMLGYDGLHEYLNKPTTVAIYSGDTPFSDEVVIFNAAYLANKDRATETNTDNTGFSDEAVAARETMAKKAAFLSGRAQVKWENAGLLTLAGQCHIFETDYLGGSFANALNLGKAAHTLMNGNIGTLTGYVTAADLLALNGLNTDLENKMGADVAAHATEPIDTEKFKLSFKPVDKSMKRMQNLSRFNDDFHKQIMKLTGIPTITVRHTYVSCTVKNSVTGAVIEGATATLSVTEKVATTDHLGNLLFSQVRNGQNVVLTINAAGFQQLLIHIAVNQGEDNHFDLGMMPV